MGERIAATLSRLLRPPATLLGRTVLDLRVDVSSPLPDGPLVVAANHYSHLDPPVVTYAVGRFVRFLALDELFGSHRVFDAIVDLFQAIPIDRDGAPLGALRAAVEHLHRGGTVGLFPEGRRVVRFGETPPKRGAAWLAWMSGAPLVPVAVWGTGGALSPAQPGLRRVSVRVRVLEPMWWHRFADRIDPLDAMTAEWAAAIGEVLRPWEDAG